jgi:SAM-dependent methyltransferase
MEVKLNLGCGKKKMNGYINVDINLNVKPDILCDLNRNPYPFKSETASYILMDNVLEHLDDIISVLKECYRILKPGGILEIRVPYWFSRGAHQDPTHKHFFTENSFDFLREGHVTDFYTTNINFKLLSVKKVYSKWGIRYKILTKILSEALVPEAIIGLVFYLKKEVNK